MDDFKKNKPGWRPSMTDYRLIFQANDNGDWREVTNNLSQYHDMLLADYLALVDIEVPYGTQFLRILRDELHFEYRDCNGFVRIDVEIHK